MALIHEIDWILTMPNKGETIINDDPMINNVMPISIWDELNLCFMKGASIDSIKPLTRQAVNISM